MHVRHLDPSRWQDRKQFLDFPFRLYHHHPLWVPPLAGEGRDIFGKHPFYLHSVAAFFVAESGGKTVGRLAVLHNRRHNQYCGRKTAFFGFFDCVDDAQAAGELFAAGFDWARQRGLEEIIGPRGLIGSDSGGVLVDGFQYPPALNVPYNFPYYDVLIQSAGFVKDRDHLSGYLPGSYQLPERFYKIAGRVQQRSGFRVKTFATADEVWLWAPKVAAVHQKSFVHNHEYFPPTEEEFAYIVRSLLNVADPRLLKLVLYREEVVGFIIAYHDISAALRRCHGRLWPLGWLYILQERRRAERVNVNGVGILPELRGLGANALLYTELAKTVHEFGFKHIEVIQVDETNFKSRNDMEAIGVQWIKRHRNYRRSL